MYDDAADSLAHQRDLAAARAYRRRQHRAEVVRTILAGVALAPIALALCWVLASLEVLS